MEIRYLHLKNFRKFKEETFYFKSHKNLIIGKNGVGKSSVLEAISFLSVPKSFKGAKILDMINHKQKSAEIIGKIEGEKGNFEIKALLEDNSKKMFIFNKPVPSFSSLFSKFACFSYNSKKDMIFWNKREMWKELNYLFSVLDRDYYNILLYYNKILKHRNKLLKEGRGDEGSLGDFIKEKGKFLQEKRKIYFKEMEKRMVDFGLKVKIVYVPSLLEADYSREIEKGYTLFGIVRDRVDFYLNGLSLRYSCSEGEKRMFLFFFYRVFLDMVKEKREFSPVFVLDDFFSVMDYSMVKAYMDNWGGQVIISSLRKLEGDFNIIEIKEDG